MNIEEPGSWATVIDEERERRLQVSRERSQRQLVFKSKLSSSGAAAFPLYTGTFEETLQRIQASASASDDASFFAVSLANKGISKSNAKTLAEALVGDIRLSSLDLSGNSIGNSGALAIFQALRTNTSITSLNLEKNNLSTKGIKPLYEAIRSQNFSLVECKIGKVKAGGLFGRGQAGEDPLVQLKTILDQNMEVFNALYHQGNSVNLSDRRLTVFPDLLTAIAPVLTKLVLSSNTIRVIPDSICDFANLTYLDLSDNQIEVLPDQIGTLDKLTYLGLSNNRLTKVPEAIVLLEHLENLMLENNRISELPTGIGSLSKLRALQTDGNPCASPGGSKKAASGSTSNLLASMKERVWMGTETRESYQMKLTVLGRGNVGKTTLLRALKLQDTEKPNSPSFREALKRAPPNVATDGIEFDTWTVARTGDRLVFTVLDCAGQSVYHLTHQFFLTGKSLFLVVFSLEEGNYTSEIEYWLNAIQAFTGSSPVLIVGTHIDVEGVTREYVRSLFQYLHRSVGLRFPMIKGYFGVSCTTGEGVTDLIDQILSTVSTLPWIPTTIPVSFDVLREKLIGMEMVGRQILTRREFSRLAIVCGITMSQVSDVLQWFSDIGLILHFENVGGSLLQSTVVLSPQWLANLFKTIITLKANYVHAGFLQVKDLQHIWKPPSVPPQLHSRCVALLEHFEAVYRFSPDLLLVPSLLPREPSRVSLQKHWPEVTEARFLELIKIGDWENCHHARLFIFKTFPPDFFSRLLVRILRTRAWSPVVLWANGAVLRSLEDEAQAAESASSSSSSRKPVVTPRSSPWMPNSLFIEIDPQLNLISIRSRGSQSAMNIARMSNALASLVQDWLKIQFEVFVPCFCSMNKRLSDLSTTIHSLHKRATDASESSSSQLPKLPQSLASAYALCVEDILQRDMEAHSSMVTEALGILALASGEELPFRHFLAFFINGVERYRSRANRSAVSFISSQPVAGSEGQSMHSVFELLKQGSRSRFPPPGSPAVDGPENEDSETPSFWRSLSEAAGSSPDLAADIRVVLSCMGLQSQFEHACIECSIENTPLPDAHFKALALAIRHASLLEARLVSLRLVDCQISPRREGLRTLIEAVCESDSVRELDLSHNNLGELGLEIIIDSLNASASSSQSLWSLILDHVDCSADAALRLIRCIASHSPLQNPQTYLSSLSLRDNNLGPEFFEQLVPILRDHVCLWSLNFESNPGCASPAFEACAELLHRNQQISQTLRYIYNKALANVQLFPSGEAVWQLGHVVSKRSVSTLPPTDVNAKTLLYHLILTMRTYLPVGDRSFRRRAYTNSFTAREVVSFISDYLLGNTSRPCIVVLLDRMVKQGWLVPVSKPSSTEFCDSDHIYRFGPEELLPHSGKKYSQLLDELKRNLPRLVTETGAETECFLASDAVEYLSTHHESITASDAESLLEYLSEFSVIYHSESPGQRFFNSDRDYYVFGSMDKFADILQTSGEIHLFPLSLCSLAVSSQQLVFRCPRWHLPIRVDGLVPDIALDGLPVAKFDLSEITRDFEVSSPTLADVESQVFCGTYQGKKVAIKVVSPRTQASSSALSKAEIEPAFAEFRREVWMMCSVRHKYILSLVGFSLQPLALMLEWMDAGDLAHYIRSQAPLPWKERLRLLSQVAKGMKFLHSNCPPICHLDFKSPNVLLTHKPSSGKLLAKVSDFGLSRSFELTVAVGSITEQDNCIWLAPEILHHKPTTIKADSYSFAIVMWEMFRWTQPYSQHRFMHLIHAAVLAGERPETVLTPEEQAHPTKKRYVDLMTLAWNENPILRPPFDEIVNRLEVLRKIEAGESVDPSSESSRARRPTISQFGETGVIETPVSPTPADSEHDLYSVIRVKRLAAAAQQ